MPYIEYEYRTVKYHSALWGDYVEQGWTTQFVREGVAFMIRKRS